MQNGSSSTQKRQPVTHVIFDCDNTLVNSIDRAVEVIEQAIQRWTSSKHIMSDRFRNNFPNFTSTGQFADALEAELGFALDRDEVRRLLNTNSRSGLRLLPGVERLLLHLHRHRIPMAVATGATRENFDFTMSGFPAEITSLLGPVICSDDEELGGRVKPDAEYYRLAGRRFHPLPKSMASVLIFEDSITGIQGALESGGQTALVTKWKEATFTEENRPLIERVDLVLETLEEFVPEDFGLPPYSENE